MTAIEEIIHAFLIGELVFAFAAGIAWAALSLSFEWVCDNLEAWRDFPHARKLDE